MKNNEIFRLQCAATLVLQNICLVLHISRDDFCYTLAESLGKQDKSSTVLAYLQKVPQKFLLTVTGYKGFKKGLLDCIEKLCAGNFLCNVDGEAVRSSWSQHRAELIAQLDKIHERAIEIRAQTASVEIQKRIEDFLS